MTQAPRVICPFWFLAQVPLQVLLELAEERALVELAEHPLEVHKVAAANAHAHHELRELQGEGGVAVCRDEVRVRRDERESLHHQRHGVLVVGAVPELRLVDVILELRDSPLLHCEAQDV